MAETITAVYEQGVLRPLTPLHLSEHARVRLQILPDPPPEELRAAIATLIAAGALAGPVGESSLPPPSASERRELAERLGRGLGKPASEMIIEDRGPL